MNTLLITSLSLLVGIAAAGSVWYIWGLIENIVVLRQQRIAEAEARRLDEEAATAEAEIDGEAPDDMGMTDDVDAT